MLIDFGDVVVHIFHAEKREFYGLEDMWNDAPRLTL
jgi:ribosome-associated protein